MDLLFGLTATSMLILGLIVMGVAYFLPGIPKKFSTVFIAIGAIMFLIGGASMTGLLAAPDAASVADDDAVYDVTYTESNTWQTVDTETNTITIAMNYNTTSNVFVGGTGTFAGNFTIARGDALITDAVATIELGSVGEVSITGAAAEPIIGENADKSSQFKLTKASGAYSYEEASVLVEAGSSNYCLLNVTLNADAVDGMVQYESVEFSFEVAGETWTVVCILTTLSS